MGIDDSRRPEPGEPQPQPGPVPSDDGLTGNEFGRPPPPGEAGPDGLEEERAEDVEAGGGPGQAGQPPRGSSNQTILPSH